MAQVNRDVRYLETHEWVRSEGVEMVLGISDHAQEQLGDIVFVELPEVGRQFREGDVLAVVESVKAASDIYAPCDGEVIAVNEELADAPELVNGNPYDEGWFCRFRMDSEPEGLLEPEEYAGLMDEGE